MLALLTAIAGVAATLALDQLWLQSWASSGRAFPVGQRVRVQMPVGSSLVYYESPDSVPLSNVSLQVFNDQGERIRAKPLDRDVSYRLLFTGWSGRALWQLDLPRSGVYRIACHNNNVIRDEDLNPADRVVFLKQPDSLEELSFVRTFIQVTGATFTMTAVMFLYVMHALALHRRMMHPANLVEGHQPIGEPAAR